MSIIERRAQAAPGAVERAVWLAQKLRVTCFPSPGIAADPSDWWRTATAGDEPETRTVKPALRERIEQGPFGDTGRLMLVINPLSIVEWAITVPDPAAPPDEIPSVGPVSDLVPRLLEIVGRWAPTAPVWSRIAFGIEAFLPTSGHAEGYRLLAEFLRTVQIDPEGSSDFLYRINRPRPSTMPFEGLRINRLSTWNVLRMGVLAQTSSTAGIINERYACHVSLDVNTAPTFTGTFGPDVTMRVVEELSLLAAELLERGDVP